MFARKNTVMSLTSALVVLSLTVWATTAHAGGNYVSQGGLTWMPITSQGMKMNWDKANSYCANTTINGQSGWRLPTKDELRER